MLYNYYAIINEHQLCPDGWHVPSKEECLELIDNLGGFEIAGTKLKDPNHWNTGLSPATNESQFSGLPAGGRGRNGSSGEIGNYATWWSSSSHDDEFAWHSGVYPDKPGIRANPGHKASGFSIRLIKNSN